MTITAQLPSPPSATDRQLDAVQDGQGSGEFLEPREAWLRERKRGIGASEWAVALGFSPRKSPFQLALEKLGRIEPENFDDNEDIEYGLLMEPVTLEVLRRRTGRVVNPWPQNEFIRHPELSYLGCTPDAIQIDKDRGEAPAQAKNNNAFLIKEWRESPPLLTQVQIQAEIFVMEKSWGTLCATVGGNRFRYFDVDRNDRFINAALPVLKRFWDAISAGELPDVDPSHSTAVALAKMFPESNGLTVQLPGEFGKHFTELEAVKRCQKALKSRRGHLENLFKEAIGENTTGELPDGRFVTWKEQTRKEHVVRESTFRVMRQHGASDFIESPESIVARCTAALLAMGATLYHESESGSRYFELPGGLIIRLADHEANEATEGWMERREVFGIRTDKSDWQEQLEAVTGPLMLGDEE